MNINTKTYSLTDLTEVVLDKQYPYVYIKNFSNFDIYVSEKANFQPGEANVTRIPVGTVGLIYRESKISKLYAIPSSTDTDGNIEVIGAYDSSLSFFKGGSGGGEPYDDTAVKADISALQTGKADKTSVYTKSETDTKITEKVAEIVADAPEDFDTLKEMSDWIASHEEDASAMNSAILANTSNISALQTEIVNTDVSQISSVTPVLQNNTEYRYINGSVSSITISAGNDISNDDFISSVVFKAAGTEPALTVSFSFSYINDEISLSDGKQYCMIFFNDGFGIKCVWYEV